MGLAHFVMTRVTGPSIIIILATRPAPNIFGKKKSNDVLPVEANNTSFNLPKFRPLEN
jgi:hypothetical protein